MRTCFRCGVELTTTNQHPSDIRDHVNECKKCSSILGKEYDRRRSIYTSRNGVRYSLHGTKRNRPLNERCELCGQLPKTKKLDYHHWDDSNLLKGIWCCQRCHHILNSFMYPFLLLKGLWLQFTRSL